MPFAFWSSNLDETTNGILIGFGALIVLVIVLFLTGLLGKIFGLIAKVIQGTIDRGFRVWEHTLRWTGWFSYLLLVSTILGLGIHFTALTGWGWASLLCALLVLGMGIVACLAFMCISLERYEVSRGYKAVHNPAKGQELAHHFARYGDRFGPVMLGIATAATIAAFTLLNQSIYENISPSWYIVRDSEARPGYLDFLAFTLINLVRVVDILDLLRSSHFLNVSIVRQGAWPVTTLFVIFKSFFTLVLVQQVMAAVREQKLLWQMIADFWSPHTPIHERARGALSQFGPLVVPPVLQSLGQAELLTREQRDELPKVLAEIGPLAIPILKKYLTDEREVVRGVTVVTLGHLRAVEVAPDLAIRCRDDGNESVRACAADALGAIGEAYASHESKTILPGQAIKKQTFLFSVIVSGGKLSIRAVKFVWRNCRKVLRPTWKMHYDNSLDPLICCIEPLRYALMDTSAAVRAQAAAALGRIGPSAADATADLIRLMQTGTEQERCLTIESLGKLKSFPETVVPALIPMTSDAAAQVRIAAAGALGEYRDRAAEAVPSLVALLDDPLDAVRTAATSAVHQIGTLDQESTKALEEKLSHPDNLKRAQTAESLGEMGETAHSAAPALVDSLNDENDLVRSKAAEALGRIGETAANTAVPALIKALQDEDNNVKAMAAEALGQMGTQAGEAVSDLLKVLQNGNPHVRARAAGALGQIRALEARPQLEIACRDEDATVKVEAIAALGKLGRIEVGTRETLLGLLEDADPQVRAAAAETLASGGPADEQTVARVAALLDDGSEEVATRTLRVLPRFGAGSLPSLMETLCRRLTDEMNAQVSLAAAQALGQFGPAALPAGPSLVIAAQTGDMALRRSSLRALAMILPTEAVAAFIAGLRDAETGVRIMASAGLIKIVPCPEDQFPTLLESLRDPELRVRANAVRVLSSFESLPEEAEPLLIESAGLPKTGLRRNIAFALRRFDTSNARDALQILLVDPNERVRKAAEDSLRILDPENATEAVREPAVPQELPPAIVAAAVAAPEKLIA